MQHAKFFVVFFLLIGCGGQDNSKAFREYPPVAKAQEPGPVEEKQKPDPPQQVQQPQPDSGIKGSAKNPINQTLITVVELYQAFENNPEEAKKKYDKAYIRVTGVVHKTNMTPFGILVFLRHRNDKNSERYNQDRVSMAFFFPGQLSKEKEWDMGFDIQFDDFGNVPVPWRDGFPVILTTVCLFQPKENDPGVTYLSFIFPKIE